MDDQITEELRKSLHEHDLRINSIEIKHDEIKVNVTDLKADRKRLFWIVITILVSGFTYGALAGLEGIIYGP